MAMKVVAVVVAVALMLVYLAPYILKMRDFALGAVILAGLVMMLVDLVQSLRSKDD